MRGDQRRRPAEALREGVEYDQSGEQDERVLDGTAGAAPARGEKNAEKDRVNGQQQQWLDEGPECPAERTAITPGKLALGELEDQTAIAPISY